MSLYSDMFYAIDINALFTDEATVAQFLRVESALAQAQAENDIIPKLAADVIEKVCSAKCIDIEKLKLDIVLSGNAAIPLVKQLTERVKDVDESASKYVHLGATSQDIVDTATVLQIHEFIGWLEQELASLENQLVEITKKHRQTVMVGRTLMQQAKPITFGLKTALWLDSILRTKERLQEVKNRVLIIQLSGAVGNQNSNISESVKKSFAKILNLKTANSWHTQRDNLVEFASVLGVLSGSLGKIAKDVALLMQTEVGEVFEGAADGKGGSSTMPNKRNPVTSTAILANAQRIPNLVATMLVSMIQEHERSVGLWHSEWEVLTEIMQLTAGSLVRIIELISGLEVDSERMLQNLELTHGLIYAENVSLALAQKIGKSDAHTFVEKACKTAIAGKKHLKEVLKNSKIDLADNELNELFKPENSIGLSLEIIDRILDSCQII